MGLRYLFLLSASRRDGLHQALGEAFLRFLASAIAIPHQHEDSDTGGALSGFCHPWKHKDLSHGCGPLHGDTVKIRAHRTGRVSGREEQARGPRPAAGLCCPGKLVECHCSSWGAGVLWQPARAGIPGKARDGKIITWTDNHLN